MNNPSIEEAEGMRERAARAVHDLIQLAYDAGRQRGDVPGDVMKPSAKTVTDTISLVERSAVRLAHARMEETARMCGFEGLTEALGYLIQLRDNPIAGLIREAVNLCIVGDIEESEDTAASGGWGNWLMRAKATVGDKAPPPEVVTVHTATGEALDRKIGMMPELAADFEHKGTHEGVWPQMSGRGVRRPENEVLSGCAVRAAIQREQTDDAAADIAEHDARMAELYGKPQDDGGEGDTPVTGRTEPDTGGATTS